MLDILHVKIDIGRHNGSVSCLINDIKLFPLQRIAQRGKIIKETPYRTAHPSFGTINVFDTDSLVSIFLIEMKMRGINGHLMTSFCQTYRDVFGKLFKASVVIRNTTGADKGYFH